jgi:hypothetical protein
MEIYGRNGVTVSTFFASTLPQSLEQKISPLAPTREQRKYLPD